MFKKLTKEIFVERAIKVHGDSYDYSKAIYTYYNRKLEIICKKHGSFFQQPNNHIFSKQGCKLCGNIKLSEKLSKSTKEFICELKLIYGDLFDYSEVNYSNQKSPVTLICNKHSKFKRIPNFLLRGEATCPKCQGNIPKGELFISNFLKENNLNFIPQHKFSDCKYKRCLPFDFYIPKLNLCIEFYGRQHYDYKHDFGGKSEFELVQIRDNIKQEYCKNNQIGLEIISYKENTQERLEDILKVYSEYRD
jgi:hypothetical protein